MANSAITRLPGPPSIDVIAGAAATSADWSNNSHKITSLAAATAAGDAIRYEQVMRIIGLTSDATSITTNTILANITGLSFAVGASEKWIFEFLILYTASAAGDIKIAFTAPTGANGGYSMISTTSVSGLNQAAATGNALTAFGTALTFGGAGVGIGVGAMLCGVGAYTGDGSHSGSIQFQAAQGTSDSGATTIRAGSMLRVWQAT